MKMGSEGQWFVNIVVVVKVVMVVVTDGEVPGKKVEGKFVIFQVETSAQFSFNIDEVVIYGSKCLEQPEDHHLDFH